MSIEFLVATLVIVATPGTGVLYTLAAGLARVMTCWMRRVFAGSFVALGARLAVTAR